MKAVLKKRIHKVVSGGLAWKRMLFVVVIFSMIMEVNGERGYVQFFDQTWWVRKGVEVELMAMAVALGDWANAIVSDMGTAKISKRAAYRQLGRALRIGDALQEMILESAGQKTHCWD